MRNVNEMILKEGGNVFRTEPKDPDSGLTQRIATSDVDTTINWMNKTFGFKFVDADKLGTTGKKVKPDGSFEENSSGDIDLNVDVRELPKEEIIAKLTAWCQKQGIPDLEIMNKGRTFTAGWIANAGLQVHFRTPINGDPKNGYVQTDFMLTDNPDLQRGAKRGGTENFSGADRAVMLSSLARGRGLKFSPTKGLVDPEKGDEVVANSWDKIAVILLGPGAKEEDTHTVEQMLAKIKNLPEYEQLVQGIRDNFEKQGRMFPESAKGIFHGIRLAEKQKRTDEIVGRAVKGLAKGVAKTAGGVYRRGRDGVKSGIAGYKAGRSAFTPGGSLRDMPGAYAAAGGARTSIAQVGDKVSKGVDKVKKYAGVKDEPVTGRSGVARDDEPRKVNLPGVQTGSSFEDKNGRRWLYIDNDQKWYTFKNGKPIKSLDAKKGYSLFLRIKKQDPKKVIESVTLKETGGREINHAEDLIFWEGSKGAKRALQAIIDLEKGGHKNVTVKWDGSPAVIFGRDENGEFIFTDKAGYGAVKTDGKAKSPDQLKDILLSRGGGKMKDDPGRIAFADNMADVFKIYEKAVPKDYRGFFKGDLLYYTTPEVEDGRYIFQPQLVRYSVKTDSDLGKRISQSTTGIVIHREVNAEGQEGPVQNADVIQGNSVMVFPSVTVSEPPKIDNAGVKKLANLINTRGPEIDKLVDPNTLAQKQMKGFGDMMYNYINTKVDTGLDNLGKDFIKWMDTKNMSMKMRQKVTDHIKENMSGFASLWSIVSGIQNVKDDVIRQMDSAEGDVKATTAGKPGGEGYVLSDPQGSIKFVNRKEFTAANRAVER